MPDRSHTESGFFDEPNLLELARDFAPGLPSAEDSGLLVADVGCGSGPGTWTLAATLRANEVPYCIDAFDIDDDVLRQTNLPYPLYSADPLLRSGNTNGYPPDCLEYFHSVKLWRANQESLFISPTKELRRDVRFQRRDIRKDPLEADRYGAIVINHVLKYERPSCREQLFANSLGGLATGGVVVLERTTKRHSEYNTWREQLSDSYGLQPANSPDTGLPTILRRTK